MGKVEIGIYFCDTADILTKVLQKRFWSTNHMNFVQIADFDCHGNRKTKFSKKIFKILLLRSHKGDEAETLRKCS